MSPEEDVTYILMMLSRDKWTKKQMEITEDDEEEETEISRVVKIKKTRTRGKYTCETCNRIFAFIKILRTELK